MHTNTVFASLIALAKLVSSAPADATSIAPAASTLTAAAASCIVPQVIYSSLDKPFTLSALTANSIPWPVQLDPPSNTVDTSPFISRTRIAQPFFRLTGGNLTTIGRGYTSPDEQTPNKAFPAYFGPKILIFPPVPDPLLFGASQVAYSGFGAGYACDKDGKGYLELRAGTCFYEIFTKKKYIYIYPKTTPSFSLQLSLQPFLKFKIFFLFPPSRPLS